MASVKKSLYVFTTNLEHQGTLWHATPFGTVFLNRILEKALHGGGQETRGSLPCRELLDFFAAILQCFHDGDEMEHASPSCFSDLLKERYLWSEEYDEEEDEMRYEGGRGLPRGLVLQLLLLLWQAVLAYRERTGTGSFSRFSQDCVSFGRDCKGELRPCLRILWDMQT